MSKTKKLLLCLNCSIKFLFLFSSWALLLLLPNTTTTTTFAFSFKQQERGIHHSTTTTTTTKTSSYTATTVMMMASSSSSSNNERGGREDGENHNNNNKQSRATDTNGRNKKATTTPTTMTVFGTVRDDIADEIAVVAAGPPTNDNDDSTTTTTTTITTQPQPLLLLLADFCPFACRAWIALLEKDLQLFDNNIQHVCYVLGPIKDIGTKILYDISPTSKAVPVLIHRRRVFCESMAITEYIDDLYPTNNNNRLQPSEDDPIMKYNMRIFMDRYSGLTGYFYKLLKCQDSEERIEISNNLTTLLHKLEIDLQLIDDGPYLCGQQFTLADIQIFPFMERIIVVLGHYRGFEVSKSEFVHIWKWYEACTNRPSIKIAIADRSKLSMKTYHCFEQRTRNDYLNEVYECYAYNEVEYCKNLTIKSTVEPGINVYAAEIRNRKQQKDEAAGTTIITNGNKKKRKVPPSTLPE